MNSDRIKEIQQMTAYPKSVSVQQALLQVWNECEQEKVAGQDGIKLLRDIDHILTHTGEIKAHKSVHERIKELISKVPIEDGTNN